MMNNNHILVHSFQNFHDPYGKNNQFFQEPPSQYTYGEYNNPIHDHLPILALDDLSTIGRNSSISFLYNSLFVSVIISSALNIVVLLYLSEQNIYITPGFGKPPL